MVTLNQTKSIQRGMDRSGRDASSPLSTICLLEPKEGVSRSAFFDYWGDIHGVLGSRAAGVEGYWEHWLGVPHSAYFTGLRRVDQASMPGGPIFGLAEITFTNEENRARLSRSPAIGQLMCDEQNAFKGTYMYASLPGNAATAIDYFASNTPIGVREGPSVIMFLRQADDVSTDVFRGFVRDEVVESLVQEPGVMKVRAHLLESYNPQAWPTPNVNHKRLPNQQIQAFLEVGFANTESVVQLPGSLRIRQLADRMTGLISGVHVYPIEETITMVYQGRPTQAGLRGISAVKSLQAMGSPPNQRGSEVLRIVFGESVVEPLL